jgi:TetR/AcrR family transcriptional regulator
MTWKRARKPEQKEARRKAILDAARTLFSELAYEDISLNGIAREAGISKPNVYRYFSTREEIFLVIFEKELAACVRALVKKLRAIRAKDPVKAIARIWVEVTMKHRAYLDLLPHLALAMERNSSVEQIVHFKRTGFALFAELVEVHRKIYPALDAAQWTAVIQTGVSMMAGLWPLANPGENVLKALRHPDVNEAPWEFERLTVDGLAAIIRGYEKGKER